MQTGEFEGQRVCIVGGTAGIGLAIARSLAIEDCEVVIAGRDEARARRVAGGIGLNVEGRAVDVLNESSIAALFDSLGLIDHLIITAAQVHGGRFRDGPLMNARQSFEGKFWSQYLCARLARVRRSILFFSGTLSRKPMVGTSVIAAVNGAIEALGRSLAVELAPLRVNVISPGLITGTNAYSAMPQQDVDRMIQSASLNLPSRMVGNPESVAGLATAILASPYITGATFDVDGGGLIS
ncbi:SDR family oxidoreductase [Sphingomonas sp. MMS24-J45]|uniref:SDR family oxidoreductase n=1 Tax=Sphingomonas sp. MMS24-J45 TaxID=3238806 RepID=UPI0038505205